MVHKLPVPSTNPGQLVDAIVLERQGGINKDFFNGIRDEWKIRVKKYMENEGDPARIQKWPVIDNRSKTFINLYDSPDDASVQKPILAGLRSRTLNMCPACGEEGTPNTLDHYLPKSVYPHFAVLPANLFPMCDICQGEKGVEVVDEVGERLFLHPYFDGCAEGSLIKLHIAPPFDAPTDFGLSVNSQLPDATQKLVFRHISALNIAARYSSYFREQYLRLLRLAQEARDGGESIAEHLPAFRAMSRRGANAWPFVFYDAVCSNAPLLEYLETGMLPLHR